MTAIEAAWQEYYRKFGPFPAGLDAHMKSIFTVGFYEGVRAYSAIELSLMPQKETLLDQTHQAITELKLNSTK